MPRTRKPQRRKMVYAGAVLHDTGIVHAYYFVNSEGALEDRAQIYPSPLGDFPPGAQCSYRVQGEGEGIVTEGAEFVRIWPDSGTVEEWQARHNAIGASEAAWASKDLPRPFQALEPLRAAYRRLDEERQGVLIAQLVRYIVADDE